VKNEKNAPVVGVDSEKAQHHSKRAWLAKLTCLFIAFIFWLYVMQVDSPEHEEVFHSVNVTLLNTSVLEGEYGLSIYSGYGSTVDVTVIGSKSVVKKLSAGDIHVTADVSKLRTSGSHSVPIDVELPSGLSLGALSQSTVQVYCDEKASAVVDVRAKITSFTMASRLEMGELEPEYDTILVTGPRETLDTVDYALLTLEFGEISSSVTASGNLVLFDKNGNRIDNPYLRLSRSEVTVKVPVYTTRTLPLKAAYKYGFFNEDNVDITVQPAKLTVRGDPEVLDRMTEIVAATLDEKKIIGDVTQQVQLELPETVEAVDGTENVTIRIAHKNTYTSMFNVTDIDVIGASGIKYNVLDKYIAVTVRGTLEQLRVLRSSDFSAVIDLSGYSAQSSGIIREHADIRIDAVGATDVYELGEYTVQVKLN